MKKKTTIMDAAWHEFVTTYGLWGLGGASFLSATLVPLSSEAILIAGVASGLPIAPAFIVCAAANCLACAVNYGAGALFRTKLTLKLEASASGRRAIAWMERWGKWSLFGSWLPLVGDPLTIVAGAVNVRLAWFVTIVFGLRILRYGATLYGASLANLF